MVVLQYLLCVLLSLRLCVSFVIVSPVEIQSASKGPLVRLEKKPEVLPVQDIKLYEGNSSLMSLLKLRENATYKLWGKEYFGSGFDTFKLRRVNSNALKKLLRAANKSPHQSTTVSLKSEADDPQEPESSYDLGQNDSNSLLLKTNRENIANINDSETGVDSEKMEYFKLIKNFTKALVSSLKRAPKLSDGNDEEDEIITTTDSQVTELPGTQEPEYWEAYQGSTVPIHPLQQPTESLEKEEELHSFEYDNTEPTTEEISTLAENSVDQYSAECPERSEQISLHEKVVPADSLPNCAKGLVAYFEKIFAPWWKGGFYGKGRGRRKKAMKRLLMPILAMALVVKTFLVVAVGLIAAVAGKSALVSFAALALAGTIALLGGAGLRGSPTTAYGLHRLDTAPDASAGPQHITPASPLYVR